MLCIIDMMLSCFSWIKQSDTLIGVSASDDYQRLFIYNIGELLEWRIMTKRVPEYMLDDVFSNRIIHV